MYFDLKFGLVCCLNAQPIHLTILTNYLSGLKNYIEYWLDNSRKDRLSSKRLLRI